MVASAAINPKLLTSRWDAEWICADGTSAHDYSVQHLRKTFQLSQVPGSFIVHVSADNRYQLFVNGKRVGLGPSRGQLDYWYFESYDLAPYLVSGENVIAAVVWNFGDDAPMAQETSRTAFILQGNHQLESIVNTDASWVGIENPAYNPLHYSHGDMHGYYVAGPGDHVDGLKYPWGWQTEDFDESDWNAVQQLGPGAPLGASDSWTRWMLVPCDIPAMEETVQTFTCIRKCDGIAAPDGFPNNHERITIPAKSSVEILLDQSVLTTAYPEIRVSGGRGAKIRLGYAECLFETQNGHFNKGDRGETAGKTFIGYYDEFMPDGGEDRIFRPLWWRTFRYVKLLIETSDEALIMDQCQSVFTAYPFEMKATLDAGDPLFGKLLETGWRTARLCANETYMDCPYYEQLQYLGDTRLQALVSYYNSGDARLARKALQQLNLSRNASGLTFSRAPSRLPQYIPGFSLWWIGMLHDYFYFANDPEFVESSLEGVQSILDYFINRTFDDGTLGVIPWWNFADWTSWPSGNNPRGSDGRSAIMDLQFLLAYQWAAEMFAAFHRDVFAEMYAQREQQLRASILHLYWDESRNLIADTTAHDVFSQHANALAILSGIVIGENAVSVAKQMIEDPTLEQCSYYYHHYLFEALMKTGLGDRYLSMLEPWKHMLDLHLSTWAERADQPDNPSRSDCHAWSASPNYHLFRIVLGIRPDAPGFRKVLIEPALGDIKSVRGNIPHPDGCIEVSYNTLDNGVLLVSVGLPPTVSGIFVWKERSYPLVGGENQIEISD